MSLSERNYLRNYDKDPKDYYGRRIVKAEEFNNGLGLTFDDGITLLIYDDGQMCCENRYMQVDDNVNDLFGHKLVAIETNEAKSDDAEAGLSEYHQICFLDIKTDGGMISMSFHNEHNGYYSGFMLGIKEI